MGFHRLPTFLRQRKGSTRKPVLVNGSIDKALHNIDQSYWCDFEDGFSYMDIDEPKMRNSIYGNTERKSSLTSSTRRKAKLHSFLMRSYYKKPIKPITDLPKENALYISFNHAPTLEDVYGIPESGTLHIHGDATRKEGLPLLSLKDSSAS